jgi:hypothetical protein
MQLDAIELAELKREILLKIVDDVPELIPKDFVTLFQEIQNIST